MPKRSGWRETVAREVCDRVRAANGHRWPETVAEWRIVALAYGHDLCLEADIPWAAAAVVGVIFVRDGMAEDMTLRACAHEVAHVILRADGHGPAWATPGTCNGADRHRIAQLVEVQHSAPS